MASRSSTSSRAQRAPAPSSRCHGNPGIPRSWCFYPQALGTHTSPKPVQCPNEPAQCLELQEFPGACQVTPQGHTRGASTTLWLAQGCARSSHSVFSWACMPHTASDICSGLPSPVLGLPCQHSVPAQLPPCPPCQLLPQRAHPVSGSCCSARTSGRTCASPCPGKTPSQLQGTGERGELCPAPPVGLKAVGTMGGCTREGLHLLTKCCSHCAHQETEPLCPVGTNPNLQPLGALHQLFRRR